MSRVQEVLGWLQGALLVHQRFELYPFEGKQRESREAIRFSVSEKATSSSWECMHEWGGVEVRRGRKVAQLVYRRGENQPRTPLLRNSITQLPRSLHNDLGLPAVRSIG